MPCAPRPVRQLLCFVMAIAGLFCQVLAASAQDYVRRVTLPEELPRRDRARIVSSCSSSLRWRTGSSLRAEPAGPRASLPAVQRALDSRIHAAGPSVVRRGRGAALRGAVFPI
jgi:hypothetical protein